MPAIHSTAIKFADYNPNSMELYLTFVDSGTYTYYGVPRDIYDAFLKSFSKGKFYNEYIRDRYVSNK